MPSLNQASRAKTGPRTGDRSQDRSPGPRTLLGTGPANPLFVGFGCVFEENHQDSNCFLPVASHAGPVCKARTGGRGSADFRCLQ